MTHIYILISFALIYMFFLGYFLSEKDRKHRKMDDTRRKAYRKVMKNSKENKCSQ